jgi:hypothetical protein
MAAMVLASCNGSTYTLLQMVAKLEHTCLPQQIVPIAKAVMGLITSQKTTPLIIISITMGMRISRAIIPGAGSLFLTSIHRMIGQTHA